jgi:UDP-N-acetylmuramoyl-tripeptide--D-alanyl-D-alanine ligase
MKGQGRAIAVLGDMLEMGDASLEIHQQLGEKVGALSIDLLIALGKEAPMVVESAIRHGLDSEKAKVVGNHSEAVSMLKQLMRHGDWVLVKGSRRMAMEKIVEGLMERGA